MDSDTTPAAGDTAAPRLTGRLWIAFCALLAVLAVSAVVLIVDGVYRHRVPDAAPMVTASPTTDRLAQLPAPAAQAYDGGSLKLVEQGFTQLNEPTELTLTPGYGPGHPEPYMPVRVGIVVENTSRDEVAYSPRIHIDYLDASGTVLPVDWDSNGQPTGVSAIFPGERADLAAYFSLDAKTVASIKVQITGAVWLARSDAAQWVSPVKTDGVSLIGTGSPEVHLITFKVHSGYAGPVNALPYAVYRDASGKILGSTDTGRTTTLYLAPGDSVGSITVTDWLPAGLDASHIEVYLRLTGLP